MKSYPTVQDLTDQRKDWERRRQRRLPPTPPRDRKGHSQDSRSLELREFSVMERIEEHPSPPPFGGLNRAWLEARAKENELVQRERRIKATAIALMTGLGVLTVYAVVVTVALASTQGGFGFCPVASPDDNHDRVARAAVPVAMALQVKAQQCMGANGTFIKATPECVSMCKILPKMPECTQQANTSQPATATATDPTERPVTSLGGEEEDSLRSGRRGDKTNRASASTDQDSDAAAAGRLDVRLVRETRAANATVKRVCLCSRKKRRGCRCVKSSKRCPFNVVRIHHGKEVDLRVHDQDTWLTTN